MGAPFLLSGLAFPVSIVDNVDRLSTVSSVVEADPASFYRRVLSIIYI